jgi:uncharacterized protein (DUF2141 family)
MEFAMTRWMIGIGAAGSLMALSACAEAQSNRAGVEALGAQSTQALDIRVQGIRGREGRLMIAVYDRAEPFAEYDAVAAFATLAVTVGGPEMRVTLHSVPDGRYAVALYHDANSDGAFNMAGETPIEGYGVSNGRDAFDEPAFNRAAIAVGPASATVAVTVHYLD